MTQRCRPKAWSVLFEVPTPSDVRRPCIMLQRAGARRELSSGCGLVECVWSDGGVGVVWGPWSACSVVCGVGDETRRRVLCSPAHSRPCQTVAMMQTRRCIRRACKPGISPQYHYNYIFFRHK